MLNMLSIIISIRFLALFTFEFGPAKAQTWIQAGYWYSRSEFPASDINSTFYTHLICAFADLNSSSYELSLSSADDRSFSNFTNSVRRKNQSIKTLLSIGGGTANYSTFTLMVSNPSHRKSFIDSSIKLAREYGFQGLDLSWVSANTRDDMVNMGALFDEWRAAISSEARNSSLSELILTAVVQYSPHLDSTTSFPIASIRKNLNWVHVMAFDYHKPTRDKFTAAQAALYDPNDVNTDSGIAAWINGGLPASRLVLGLPFYGYAWTLVSPNDNSIGAPATGPAISEEGDMSYKDIKNYINGYGVTVLYNAAYVVNYCIIGSAWIGFDDVEVVRIKVSYAKEKALLGYVVWQVPYDDNSVLSQAAAQMEDGKRQLLVIVLTTTAAAVLLLSFILCYIRKRIARSKGIRSAAIKSKLKVNGMAAAAYFSSNDANLVVYNLADMEKATEGFSLENKLGQGGYGPVYKGVLPDGQEIAVKKLSKGSTQGFEEFKNEVLVTAKLQHVNLVRLLGFCTYRGEQMLVYEYMPNRSLDYYLFDPIRRHTLDWTKRVAIIEGVTQGLLYLQEYSRLTIIHRDLKASNILLDDSMKPKISDFGMARIFKKDGQEANTDRIVGTYGYVPPEYVKQGLYSTKSDVYSFGVLLLQIISGKRNACLYGVDESLSLLEYAYEMWKDGKGMEVMDDSLDDTQSSCKLVTCMQIALLCVQENPRDRPSMLEVVSMLKNETAVVKLPRRPAFSTKNDDGDINEPALQLEIFSVNDASISEVVGR